MTLVRDDVFVETCEAHVRAVFGQIVHGLSWLYLPLLDAVRQGRWQDARYYAANLHDNHPAGSVTRRQMGALLIRLSGK